MFELLLIYEHSDDPKRYGVYREEKDEQFEVPIHLLKLQ